MTPYFTTNLSLIAPTQVRHFHIWVPNPNKVYTCSLMAWKRISALWRIYMMHWISAVLHWVYSTCMCWVPSKLMFVSGRWHVYIVTVQTDEATLICHCVLQFTQGFAEHKFGRENKASIMEAILNNMSVQNYLSYFNIQYIKKVLLPKTILYQLQTTGFILALGVSTPE